MEPDDLLSAALEYAAAGIPVFPCGQDKRPLVKNWRHVATTDPAQLQAWWRAWPAAMIGIPTGARSGFYVVDIDQHGGVDGMANYRALDVPRAAVAAFTPSGGGHAYFHFPVRDGATPPRPSPLASTRGARAASSSRRRAGTGSANTAGSTPT